MISSDIKTLNKSKEIPYEMFLKAAQEYLTKHYPELLIKLPGKDEFISYLTSFYNVSDYTVKESKDTETLMHWLYNDMAQYSILTDFVNGSRKNIEEVNINSWEDIVINYDDGRIEKSSRKFFSPQHAIDVIKKLLHESGMILDVSKPKIVGYLNKNVRITATISPVVDEDVGVSISIRIINPKKLSKQDFIDNNTSTADMLEMLCTFLRYNISICVPGATGSGKTTLLDYILKSLPPKKRIITIEEKVREFDLVKRDTDGNILNNVVQMKTIEKDNKNECITSEDLLVLALTMDPDVISIAEMKSEEAFATQEAARTGHAVITTTHADSAEDTYDRMTTLCMLKHNMDYNITNTLVRKAFPIVCYAKELEDHTRHIMSIVECYYDENSMRFKSNVLYRYIVEQNIYNNNDECIEVKGHFEHLNGISESLKNKLRDNGIPSDMLKKLEG